MLSRADLVLVAIPLLAASGLAVRFLVAVSGVGTALLALPLAPAGYLAAFAFLLRELFVGPTPRTASGDETRDGRETREGLETRDGRENQDGRENRT